MSIIKQLKKKILVDGFHIIADLEKSSGSWLVHAETGNKYLDCYSQFASQPVGWNHPSLVQQKDKLDASSLHKIANSDMYTNQYADFVESFSSITPDFDHYFFVSGGALGIENALKAAFDWKCQVNKVFQKSDGQDLDVVHLKEAFHRRSGYTLSLTNTGSIKTKWFPKFNWTRINNPKITFPLNKKKVKKTEDESLLQAEVALKRGNVAAVIIEPIQGEGGDNHFRKRYMRKLRSLTLEYDSMLIVDEVQTGFGLTGKMWSYEHFDIIPDMMCFGKKTQVCGFCSTKRIDKVKKNVFKQSGRINSTWGGNIVDMVRCDIYIDILKKEKLVNNAKKIGNKFIKILKELNSSEISNVRGKGLMLAFDLSTVEKRDEMVENLSEKMLVLKCGEKSIRFRPHLTFNQDDLNHAEKFLKEVI